MEILRRGANHDSRKGITPVPVGDGIMEEAPNYRHGMSCSSCEHGYLRNRDVNFSCLSPFVQCSKHGIVHPGGLCDDWEDD
ncbi:MAG: hypothetical protein PHT07_23070 [Paludibacter sp.]|nr:hypothetical protein [Paludibacter sp.]